MTADSFSDSVEFHAPTPAEGPDARLADWVLLHQLIEELSAVQRRLGTPMEEPEDYLRVRTLGSAISESLERVAFASAGAL